MLEVLVVVRDVFVEDSISLVSDVYFHSTKTATRVVN